MIENSVCVWYLKNIPLSTAFNWFFIGKRIAFLLNMDIKDCVVAEWENTAQWTGRNDKWIGKLYFYYMKNHLYCAINARSKYEKLRKKDEKWPHRVFFLSENKIINFFRLRFALILRLEILIVGQDFELISVSALKRQKHS